MDAILGNNLSDGLGNASQIKEGNCKCESKDNADRQVADHLLNSSGFRIIQNRANSHQQQSGEGLKWDFSEVSFPSDKSSLYQLKNNINSMDDIERNDDLNLANRHREWTEEMESNPLPSNVNIVKEDDNLAINGCLNKEPTSIDFISTSVTDSRLSGNSDLSDDCFVAEDNSLSSLSKPELISSNTTDSFERKQDDGSPIMRCEYRASKSSSEIHHLSRESSFSEKEHSKKKISFRALVRMKGLGRKLRIRKNQEKSKQKQSNKKDSKTEPLLFSDSSCKYLLESSTTDEYSQCVVRNSIAQDEQDQLQNDKKCHSLSRSNTPEQIVQNDWSSSLSDIVCNEEYLIKRRFAVCEEIEKSFNCGDQSLAELRSILVIQHKLTGFGLL